MTQSASPKKMCWNCDGNVDLNARRCPYCASDLDNPVRTHVNPQAQSHTQAMQSVAPPYQVHEPVRSEATREVPESTSTTVWPVAMLLTGAVFLLFGIALFLHSDRGMMSLAWSSDYWSLYVLSALPLLYFGWKRLPK